MYIKIKIEALIKTVKEAIDKYNEVKAEWEANTVYSAQFVHEKIREEEEVLLATVNDANVSLQAILQAEIDEIRNKKADGNNFELQLSNTLAFLTMIGDNLKDEAAFAMIQPFFGDYQTMHNLSMALSGRTGIPATLFAVTGYDSAIARLKNMQIKYKTVFHNHQDADSSLANSLLHTYFMTDVDAYEAFLVRLNKYLSASAFAAEKVVADHSRFEFGLSKFTTDENSSEGLRNSGVANSRTFRELIAKRMG